MSVILLIILLLLFYVNTRLKAKKKKNIDSLNSKSNCYGLYLFFKNFIKLSNVSFTLSFLNLLIYLNYLFFLILQSLQEHY